MRDAQREIEKSMEQMRKDLEKLNETECARSGDVREKFPGRNA